MVEQLEEMNHLVMEQMEHLEDQAVVEEVVAPLMEVVVLETLHL